MHLPGHFHPSTIVPRMAADSEDTVARSLHDRGEKAPERDPAREAPEAMATGRLETFADGVFAIAITLLVLQIRVPPAGTDLGRELVAEWPSFVAYVASFLSIGIMWVNHHRLFLLVRRASATFLMINVLFLMAVSFLPFPTAVLAIHVVEPAGQLVATLLYGGTMIVIAVMFNVLWLYAAGPGHLLRGDVDTARLRMGTSRFVLGPLVYLAITLLAFIQPLLSLGAFTAFALYWLLPGSGPYRAVE